MPEAGPNLAEALRRYWGYHEFRPKQESVIRSLLAAHDTCVVIPPTGGGEVAVLPTPGGGFGEDGGGGFSADRADAGPGGATGANGHTGGGDQ